MSRITSYYKTTEKEIIRSKEKKKLHGGSILFNSHVFTVMKARKRGNLVEHQRYFFESLYLVIRLRSRKLGEPARRGIEGDRLLLERRFDALDEAEEELEEEAEEDADETSESESEEDEEEVEWSDLLETEESELEDDDEEDDDDEERDRCFFFFFLDDWPS